MVWQGTPYFVSGQFLNDIQKGTQRECQAAYAVDVEGGSIAGVGQASGQGWVICVVARALVLVHSSGSMPLMPVHTFLCDLCL